MHILPHWTWPGFEGKPIPVWVFTNADTVELFLNGKSLGVKRFPQDCDQTNGQTLHLVWSVPYQPGVLKAVGMKRGKIYQVDEVRTAGDPTSIALTPDRSVIAGDGQDLSFVKVSVLDNDGVVCPNASNEIKFTVNGALANIVGLDNGDPTNHEQFQGSSHLVFHGLGLVVIRSNPSSSGKVTVTASSPSLASASIALVLK